QARLSRRGSSWRVRGGAAGFPGAGAIMVGVALLYPEAAAARQRFAFPEWGARFQRVDHVFTAAERVASVRAGRRHEHDLRAARQRAHAVGDDGAGQLPALLRGVCDALQFAFAHAGVMVEKERFGGLPRREIAHVSGESDDGASFGAYLFAQLRKQGRAVEVGFLNDDHGVQPPVTGSKTATSSPGRIGDDGLACVWLMASFRRAAGASCGYRACSASSSSAPVEGSARGQTSLRVPTSSAIRAKYKRLIVAPFTAFTSCLVFKAYLFNDDALVGGLAHVVDGERGHAGRCHGFHFDAGGVVCAARRAHLYGMRVVVERKVDPGERQRQAV